MKSMQLWQHAIDPELVCLELTLSTHSYKASKHPSVACPQEVVMVHGMLSCSLGNLKSLVKSMETLQPKIFKGS